MDSRLASLIDRLESVVKRAEATQGGSTHAPTSASSPV